MSLRKKSTVSWRSPLRSPPNLHPARGISKEPGQRAGEGPVDGQKETESEARLGGEEGQAQGGEIERGARSILPRDGAHLGGFRARAEEAVTFCRIAPQKVEDDRDRHVRGGIDHGGDACVREAQV